MDADKQKDGLIDATYRIKERAVTLAQTAGDPELAQWFREIGDLRITDPDGQRFKDVVERAGDRCRSYGSTKW
jgi:hypothetical protein